MSFVNWRRWAVLWLCKIKLASLLSLCPSGTPLQMMHGAPTSAPLKQKGLQLPGSAVFSSPLPGINRFVVGRSSKGGKGGTNYLL